MKEKSVTFCLLKLKGKEKENFSKAIWRGWLLYGEFRSLLSKLMFTHADSCWSHCSGVEGRKTRDCHRKLKVRIASRIAEFPQQFRTCDLRKWVLLGCFKRLFTWVFNDLMILELVTREFELVTCELELVTHGFELALLNFSSCF